MLPVHQAASAFPALFINTFTRNKPHEIRSIYPPQSSLSLYKTKIHYTNLTTADKIRETVRLHPVRTAAVGRHVAPDRFLVQGVESMRRKAESNSQETPFTL